METDREVHYMVTEVRDRYSLVIWPRGLPAQQGRPELIRSCYKSSFHETLQNFKL